MKTIIEAREAAETYAEGIIREISHEEWEARTLLLERLMMGVLPPPVELKGKGDNAYVKLNMMAQDVSSFEAMLALTSITAEDIDLENVDHVICEAAEKSSHSERAEAKNGKFKNREGVPLDFASVDGIVAERVKIIQVPETHFTQVKTTENYPDFIAIVNKNFENERGTEPFVPIRGTQIQGVNLQEWATRSEEYGLIGGHTGTKLRHLGKMIANYGDTLPGDEFLDVAKGAYSNAVTLMHRIRQLIFEEEHGKLFTWSLRCEALGDRLTAELMGMLLDAVINENKKATLAGKVRKDIMEDADGQVTVEELAARLNIPESLAHGALEYLASFGAESDGFKGIDRKMTDDGCVMYYYLDRKAADMSRAAVMILAGRVGQYMLPRHIRMLNGIGIPDKRIFVTTKSEKLEEVRNSLPDSFSHENIIIEPELNASAPVVALGFTVIQSKFHPASGEPTVVMMSTESAFGDNVEEIQSSITSAVQGAQNGGAIVAVGVVPDAPHTNIGYIKYDGPSKIGKDNLTVIEFIEKPDISTAKKLAVDGQHFANTGVIVMNANVGLDLYAEEPILGAWLEKVKEKIDKGESIESITLSIKAGISLRKPFSDTLRRGLHRFTVVPGSFKWRHSDNLEQGGEFFSGGAQVDWNEWRRVDENTLENRKVQGMEAKRNSDGTWDVFGGGLPAEENITATLARAKEKMENYLTKQRDEGKITDEIYKKAIKVTYKNFELWVTDNRINEISPNTSKAILEAIQQERWKDIIEVFRQDITFGTAGIRGMAALTETELHRLKDDGPGAAILKGPNTINDITLLLKTTGVIKYAKEHGMYKVAIGYDSRIAGEKFAELIAQSFLGQSTDEHRFTVYLFDEASPFPELSFGLTTKGVRADLGILISASHNPAHYNGYKITDSTGKQLSGDMRDDIVDTISTVGTQDIILKPLKDAKKGQLIWLGGETPISGKDYKGVDVRGGSPYFIDMHTRHVDQVKRFIVDGELVERHADISNDHDGKVKIGFAAFNGVGNLAVPRVLREVGFTNLRVVESLQEMDGLFPAFGWGEQPDPGDPIAANIAVNEFIKEHGQKAFDDLDILIGTDPDADRAGIIVKVPQSQQEEFGKYRLLSANDAWTLLLWYRLQRAKDLNDGILSDAAKKYITVSHVTTDALERVGNYFGVRSLGETLNNKKNPAGDYLDGRRSWTGFSYIAEFCNKMRSKGLINVCGAEESNGFSILGGAIREGEMLADDGHVNDKDGAFAAILLAEVAAYAKSRKTTLFELLDDVYLNPEIGYFATANKPLPRVGSFEGAEGVTQKIKLLQEVQNWMAQANAEANTDNPFTLGGLPVIGAVEFKTGKYDEQHYERFPDEGIRFFFADTELKHGEPFQNSRNYITIRPSGTSQTLRFYTQLYAQGLTKENLGRLKYKTSRRAEALAFAAQIELLKSTGYVGDVASIIKQLRRADYVPELVMQLIQGEVVPTLRAWMLERIAEAEKGPSLPGRGMNPEFMGFSGGHIIERYKLPMGDVVDFEESGPGISRTLYVAEGEVQVADEVADETGEGTTLNKGEFDVVAPGSTMTAAATAATVCVEYTPHGAENLVMAVPESLKHFKGRLNGREVQYACPQSLLRGEDKGKVEKFLNDNLGIRANIILFSEGIGFSDLDGKVDFGKPIVLIGTQSNFGNVNEEDKFQQELFENSVKLPALPDSITTDRENKPDYQFFNVEMFGAGFALAATGVDIQEGEAAQEDIVELQNLVAQFTGRLLTANEIYCLLPYKAIKGSGMLPEGVNTLRDVANFIKDLLMKVPARPMSQDLRDRLINRRTVQWSA